MMTSSKDPVLFQVRPAGLMATINITALLVCISTMIVSGAFFNSIVTHVKEPYSVSHPFSSPGPGESKGRRNDTFNLPEILLSGSELTYEDKNLTVGTIRLLNGSHLFLEDCNIILGKNDTEDNIYLDNTSSLTVVGTEITSGIINDHYNISSSGSVTIRRSELNALRVWKMQNSRVFIDSSRIAGVGQTISVVRSELDLINTSFHEEAMGIIGNSTIRFKEYLNVKVTSSYPIPVSFATITVTNKNGKTVVTDKTDESGYARKLIVERAFYRGKDRTDLAPFDISVSHPKYGANNIVINITAETNATVSLIPMLGSVKGWVRRGDGTGIGDATVGNGLVLSTTSADGSYILDIFSKTSYTVTVTKEHYSSGSEEAFVRMGEVLWLNFTLSEELPPLRLPFLQSSIYRVPLGEPLSVVFDARLKGSTVNISTMVLRENNSGDSVSREVRLNADLSTVTIEPSRSLNPYSWYVLTVGDGIRNTDGKAVLWRNMSFTFKTDYLPLRTTHPGENAGNVSVNSQVILKLAIPLAPDSINRRSVQLTGEKADPIKGTLSFTGDDTLVLSPNSTMAYDSTYTVRLSSELRDGDGTAVFPQGYEFSFTTRVKRIGPVLRVRVIGEKEEGIDRDVRVNITGSDAGTSRELILGKGETKELEFTDLKPDRYNITVSAEGYVPEWKNKLLVSGEIGDLVFTLKREDKVVSGEGNEFGLFVVVGLALGLFVIALLLMRTKRRKKELISGEGIFHTNAPGIDSVRVSDPDKGECVSEVGGGRKEGSERGKKD